MSQNIKLKKLLPSSYELVSFVFLDLAIILVANSHLLLTYYGLESSNKIISNSTSTAVNTGLGRLDGFGFTDEIVTFLIWALVGVFCFSVVRAIAGVYQEVELDAEMSSRRYVHPSTFTRAKFWRQVITDFAVLLLSLLLTVLVAFSLVAYVLPLALAYSRIFLLGISLASVGEVLIGLAIMYVWLVFLDLCLRIVFHHRQLTES